MQYSIMGRAYVNEAQMDLYYVCVCFFCSPARVVDVILAEFALRTSQTFIKPQYLFTWLFDSV